MTFVDEVHFDMLLYTNVETENHKAQNATFAY